MEVVIGLYAGYTIGVIVFDIAAARSTARRVVHERAIEETFKGAIKRAGETLGRGHP
jgi:hypothetical protein